LLLLKYFLSFHIFQLSFDISNHILEVGGEEEIRGSVFILEDQHVSLPFVPQPAFLIALV
jgi:hypothetical protein